ncbi:MAG: integrase family protein [Candidatus Saccharibacteria bacterium]|nr:integrase family protein [Rhodoferax sp.]
MARPTKDAAVDTSEARELTVGLIERLTCRTDTKAQAFLRDSKAPGLRVRVTNTGAKAFVFEAKLNRQTIRRTIGDVRAWSIEAARTEANRLRVTLDAGIDPREVDREHEAAKSAIKAAVAAQEEAEKVAAATVGEVWTVYVAERKAHWGERHYQDHIAKAAPGGIPSTRRGYTKELTKAGPLATLMPLALRDLDQQTIEAWAATEAKTRPTSARLAWRLLKVFLGWCSEQSTYAALLPAKNPAKTKKTREALGKAGTKSDVLQREQLAPWFAAVQQIPNPVIAACLQCMLLTGARPGEVLALRWEDVNTLWKGIAIRDKVEGTREIPATPYMLHLLAALPRRNQWVFSSPTSESGHLTEPNNPHTQACIVAGLAGLTLHGLRRSFKSLTEWLEVPVGVVAQIQGHKPSATAEKHYTFRPLELLRMHHERIEAWMLEQAGIVFLADAGLGKLRAGA